jgi:uncharacterized protein YggT (Ycf19 family)
MSSRATRGRLVAARLLVWLVGAVEALLLARFVARVFAARPDNPAIAALDALSAPLVRPLQLLDAQQPRFGSVIELSTLLLLLLLPMAGYLLWRLVAGTARPASAEGANL